MIGLLHPGAMGAAVGAALVANGHPVSWASAGRSAETMHRAQVAGLEDLNSQQALLDECSIVLSICPPEAALAMAEGVRGYAGVYVDANAVSPVRAQAIADQIIGGGGSYVDGCIIGPPPKANVGLPSGKNAPDRVSPSTTRLYLAGDKAQEVADHFSGMPLEARVIGPVLTAPSALKMAFAAWSKGSAALLLASRAMAEHFDVADLLVTEWDDQVPGLATRSEQAAKSAREKAWRWSYEMAEVAAAFQAAGLPADFGTGAADVFDRLPRPTAESPLFAESDAAGLTQVMSLMLDRPTPPS